MKKYLLHIKRQTSAPRPAEADLEWENQVDGVPVFMTQDPAVDTYIQGRSNADPAVHMLELQSMEETSHLKRNNETDDALLWAYPEIHEGAEPRVKVIPEHEDIDGEVVPEQTIYSTVTLRVLNDVGGETVFEGETAYEDALAETANLADTDGYLIFDNIQGERTQRLASRPYIVETEENKPVIKLSHQFGV